MVIAQVLAAIAQGGGLLVFLAELFLHVRLVDAFVRLPTFRGELPPDFPDLPDDDVLDTADAVVFKRGDRIVFRRAFGVIAGERGVALGQIVYGPDGPTLFWRPFPMMLMPIFFAFAVAGAFGLYLVEGEAMAFVIIPAVLPPLAFFYWMQHHYARRLIHDRLLPQLMEATRR